MSGNLKLARLGIQRRDLGLHLAKGLQLAVHMELPLGTLLLKTSSAPVSKKNPPRPLDLGHVEAMGYDSAKEE